MKRLENGLVALRALEPEDIELLYGWENDPKLWAVSGTTAPFSRHVLTQFIESQLQDIYQTRQMRLVIETADTLRSIGTFDLFDFDPINARAGVGVMIYAESDMGQGYAASAIEVGVDYCFRVLGLHQLYANVAADNRPSLALFRKMGFEVVAEKKDWIRCGNSWQTEFMLTRINK